MINVTTITDLNQGDKKAFKSVFDLYYTRFCLFVQRFGLDKDEAEDIVSQEFVKLWKGDKDFENEEHLKAFLYRSTKNSVINYQINKTRTLNREASYSQEAEQTEKDYLSHIITAEGLAELYEAVNNLPRGAGEVLRAAYFEGKSNKEIAERLGISIQTVKNQKARALLILRGTLKKELFYLFLLLHHLS